MDDQPVQIGESVIPTTKLAEETVTVNGKELTVEELCNKYVFARYHIEKLLKAKDLDDEFALCDIFKRMPRWEDF